MIQGLDRLAGLGLGALGFRDSELRARSALVEGSRKAGLGFRVAGV